MGLHGEEKEFHGELPHTGRLRPVALMGALRIRHPFMHDIAT
jgi:hypothetical protein